MAPPKINPSFFNHGPPLCMYLKYLLILDFENWGQKKAREYSPSLAFFEITFLFDQILLLQSLLFL